MTTYTGSNSPYKLNLGGENYNMSPNVEDLSWTVNTAATYGDTANNASFRAVKYGDFVFCNGTIKLKNFKAANLYCFSIQNIQFESGAAFALTSCETAKDGVCGEGYIQNGTNTVDVYLSVASDIINTNGTNSTLKFSFCFRRKITEEENQKIIRKISFEDRTREILHEADFGSNIDYGWASNNITGLQKIDDKIGFCNVYTTSLLANSGSAGHYTYLSTVPEWAHPSSGTVIPMAAWTSNSSVGGATAEGDTYYDSSDGFYKVRMHTPYTSTSNELHYWKGQGWYIKSSDNTNIKQINLGDSDNYQIYPEDCDEEVATWINTDWITANNIWGYKAGKIVYISAAITNTGNIGNSTAARSLLGLKYSPASKVCCAITGYSGAAGELIVDSGENTAQIYINNATIGGDMRFCLMYATND